MWIKLLVFLLGSAGIILFSRRSLKRKISHGLYRFFAFEFMLALVLLNWKDWFYDPFSFRQILSWLMLITCTILPLEALTRFIVSGKPGPEREDDTLIGFEKTTQLITTGSYRYIRHPMYTSLLLFTWGAFLKGYDWISTALALMASIFMILCVLQEEKENLLYFGDTYREYMKKTKRFIPFLI